MKKKWVKRTVIAAVIVCILAGIFFVVQPPKLSADGISQITIASLPSPPKKKNVTKKEDIQKLVSAFDDLRLTPRIPFGNPAGTSVWFIAIGEQQNYQISMTRSIVQINAFSYRCSEDAAEKFRALYQSLSYPEEDYITQ